MNARALAAISAAVIAVLLLCAGGIGSPNQLLEWAQASDATNRASGFLPALTLFRCPDLPPTARDMTAPDDYPNRSASFDSLPIAGPGASALRTGFAVPAAHG
ncbi:hypothetical protein [Micromonospora cremea]|uniref:Uncharacterized protein n=1 Tax=Micromonospora cremea TaxID=709881 RepID=A0A1N5UAR3_9ACTN|nr:hypothetical protein [Micromonospora cremea]SIM57902.1 hypothetical protein SAMN04489832_0759 [Micromonospora cremea]